MPGEREFALSYDLKTDHSQPEQGYISYGDIYFPIGLCSFGYFTELSQFYRFLKYIAEKLF